MSDTSGRMEKVKPADFLRFVDEIRALKNRLVALELARLEEGRQTRVEAAPLESARRARSPAQEQRASSLEEDRRYHDAEHESSKAILLAKFDRFEVTLTALSRYLGDLAPLRELEARLAQEGERQKKAAEEIRVRREVASRHEGDVAREKELLAIAEDTLRKREAFVETKLADLDVVRRTEELSRERDELDRSVRIFEAHAREVAEQRDGINREFEQLGRKRAELDREAESLAGMRQELSNTKKKMVECIAREMARMFEAAVRDLMRPSGG